MAASFQFFISQTCHHSIPVKAVLVYRGVNVSFDCPFCHNEDETILHCFLHCSRFVAVLQGCGFPDPISLSLGVDMDKIAKVIHKIVKDIRILASLIMWNIWCTRNKLVFDNIHPYMHSSVATIFFQLNLAHKAFGTDPLVTPIPTQRLVSWQHGDEGTP